MKLRYFLFLIAAILLSIDKADAGDWGFIRFAIPWNGDQVTYGDDSDFKIIGKNYNETFAVTGITYSLKFYQLPDEKLVFRKDMEGDDAQPGKQVEVNFGKVDWTNIGIGRLRIDFSMTYDFDENPSNNDSSKEIEVVSPYISRDSASGIFRNYILDKYSKLNLSYSVGYMLQDVKLKGTMINTDIYDSGGTATDKDYWIGWFNTDYTLFYSHPSSLIMIDAIKGEVDKEIPLNFWPRINNVIYPNDTQLDFDRILGKPREDDVLDTNSYLYEIGNNQNTKGPCALLIAGLGQDSRQRNGFDRSAEVMKREFQREAMGPADTGFEY